MNRRSKNKTAQQVKDKQINFILEDVEKKIRRIQKILRIKGQTNF